MSEKGEKHSTVGKTFEIDQRAIKIFLSWLSDNWLPRKQEPDLFIDYLVEIVNNGEPTGLHFAAQIKGYDDTPNGPKPLSYSFKTKHLDYYLHRSQHPVFLFLINVTTGEGYWVFAQKYLKEKASAKILNEQDSLTIHFSPEDDLLNSTKFKCLLPEAEQFVRDLHPGSIQAALQKRKAELESKDPRFAVSISIKDGKEDITISPKEPVTFQTKIRSKNIDGWRKFFESGAELKLEPGEMEIIGAPLLEEAFKKMEGLSKIQFGTRYPISIQIFFGAGENLSIVQIDGEMSTGTKFMSFRGTLPESPVEIIGEIPFDNKFRNEASLSLTLSLDKWTGQRILLLPHFDQTNAIAQCSIMSHIPKMQILVRGNILWKGNLGNLKLEELKGILAPLEWLQKCRWIAEHFNVNPALPSLESISNEQWAMIEDLYTLLENREISIPDPGHTISFIASMLQPKKLESDGVLSIENDEQMIDFFGAMVHLGRTRHTYKDMKLISQTPLDGGHEKFVFESTEKTMRTSVLL